MQIQDRIANLDPTNAIVGPVEPLLQVAVDHQLNLPPKPLVGPSAHRLFAFLVPCQGSLRHGRIGLDHALFSASG